MKPQNRRKLNLWRSTSLINLVGNSNRNRSTVYETTPLTDSCSNYVSTESLNSLKPKNQFWGRRELDSFWNSWNTIVTVVLIAAKGLPPLPNDGAVHELYCKLRLGSETLKSKSVPHSRQIEWRERFKLHLFKDNLLKLSLWDKSRQKIFMGSCVLDLSAFVKERTHDIWQELDDGYGSIHYSLTMCVIRYGPTTNENLNTVQHKHSILDLSRDSRLVGSLYVKVIGARGLSSKLSAYCTLELDNERLQTHTARSSSEPMWNKSYVLNVYDVTSVLELKVHGNLLTDAILSEFLGQISIPLLKINNMETRWYALKSRNNRSIARGNCPRILLKMSVKWNPMKATLRLFRPKEVKHIDKPQRWDIALVFRNLVIFADTYNTLVYVNQNYKCLFEWDNRSMSAIALLVWLIFCYHLTPWSVPFIILSIFICFRVYTWIEGDDLCHDAGGYTQSESGSNSNQKDKGLSYITDMQEVITTTTYVLELVVSLIEKLKNLLTFKVPFLSYVVMVLLCVLSIVLYLIPFNYLLMALGIYKFIRKYLNPDRTLNNDLLDFISRIPDNRVLKDWKEFNVPEPMQYEQSSEKARSGDI